MKDRQHPPIPCRVRSGTIEQVTEQALATLTSSRADRVVAVGGGSTTGPAKALAARTGVDQIIEFEPRTGPPSDGRVVDGPWRELNATFRVALSP